MAEQGIGEPQVPRSPFWEEVGVKICFILWPRRVGLKVDEMKTESTNLRQEGDWEREWPPLPRRSIRISVLLLYSRNLLWYSGIFRTVHTPQHHGKNDPNLAQLMYSVMSPPCPPTHTIAPIFISLDSIVSEDNTAFLPSHFECAIPLPRMHCFLLPV